MKLYEIMCMFAPQEQEFKVALDAVKKALTTLEATIEKEHDMGVKKIEGIIKKHTHAHYLYFMAKLTPENAYKIQKTVSNIPALIRVLVINRSDSISKKAVKKNSK